MEIQRVIIAKCYLDEKTGYVIVPECPFCLSNHKHIIKEIKLSEINYDNGDFIPVSDKSYVKISECLTGASLYSLLLRPKDEFNLEPLKCRSLKKDGTPCTRKSKQGYPLCGTHIPQFRDIILRQRLKLFGE